MNTHLNFVRPMLASAALLLIAPIAFGASAPAPDRAAQLLATYGSVAVERVGPYVERGTFRIQVLAKLGKPDARASTDVWIYDRRAVDGSAARGALVVRFENGRVSDLSLVSPTVALALRQQQRPAGGALIAKD